jgi:hypothetical protein
VRGSGAGSDGDSTGTSTGSTSTALFGMRPGYPCPRGSKPDQVYLVRHPGTNPPNGRAGHSIPRRTP